MDKLKEIIKRLGKKRVTVYMESGSVIFLRDIVPTIIVIKNESFKNEYALNPETMYAKTRKVSFNLDRIESVQVREWYENWG